MLVPPERDDPFFEVHENHHLIGVANVFLEVLFYDAKLDYHVPIISQQGEVKLIDVLAVIIKYLFIIEN